MKTKLITLTTFLFLNCLFAAAQQFDYGAHWIKISFDGLSGLPKSALETADLIFAQAQKEKNYPQFLKAFIHRMKYKSMITEDAFVQNLMDAEKVTDSASFPVKQVLHSMVAEMYWWYFENNRYRFYNRSRTSQFNPADIATWDLYRITDKVIDHYKLSLTGSDSLRQIKVEDFSDLLTYYQTDYAKDKPTLYDFLALRAIDFFKNEEPNLTRPGSEFSMNNDEFFLPADAFSKLNIKTTDTLSFKYYAITLLQDLIRVHLNDPSPEMLTNLDVKRLEMVYGQSQNSEKDSLYLNCLHYLEKKCAGNACNVGIGMKIAESLYALGEKYDPRKSEVHQWEKKKAREKCLSIMKQFPDQAAVCKGFIDKVENKSINITIEKENIPNEPFRALVNYRNVDTAFVRIIKTSYKEMDSVHIAYDKRSQDKYINWEVYVLDYFKKRKAVKSYAVNLPNDHDYQTHYAEIKIPSLDNGLYMILAGTHARMDYDKNVVNYGFTILTNISFINRRNSDGSNDFYVLNRKTGAPLTEVKTECWSYQYNEVKRKYVSRLLKTVLSDKEGYIHFSSKEFQQQGFYLTFSSNGDYFSNRDPESAEGYNLFYNSWNNESKYTTNRTFFFTDRSIYRPGQTIYFKGIIIRTDGNKENSIQPNLSSSVTLYNTNYQKVSTVAVTTNEYGSFSGSFTAPSTGLNGLMSIQNESGSISVSVEDYKRPKFEVKYDSIKDSYKLGEMVKVKGKAVAYSGANIDNAGVKYRVVREVRFQLWREWWWPPRPALPEKEIIHGTVTTGKNGEFEFAFKAVPDESIAASTDPTFSYKVYTDVTDINGETHSATKVINAAWKALIIRPEIPDKIDRNGLSEYKITSANANDDFVPASGSIIIDKLKSPEKTFRDRKWEKADKYTMTNEEYYQSFPNDQYMDELNPTTWKNEKQVLQTNFDTGKDKVLKLSSLKEWQPGMYKLFIRSKDQYGEPVEVTSYFTVFDKNDKKLPYPVADWYEVITNITQPGDSTRVLNGTSYDNAQVLIEVEHERKVVYKEWTTLNHEQRLFSHLVQEGYRGNFGIHCNFIYNNRLYKHTSTIQVPFTNKMLDIGFETFRNKLQPGEKDQWRLRIKGKTGEKAAAEMVATLYDASLDAFKPQSFNFDCWPTYNPSLEWNSYNCFETANLHSYTNSYIGYQYYYSENSTSMNWFGFGYHVYNNPVDIEEDLKTSKNKPNYQILSTEKASGTEVSGIVCLKDGTPFKDAIILISGTKTGTMTDSKGRFLLKTNLANVSLLVGIVGGSESQIIPLNQKGKVKIKIVFSNDLLVSTRAGISVEGSAKEEISDALMIGNAEEAPMMNQLSVKSASAGVLRSEKAYKAIDGRRDGTSGGGESEPEPDLSSVKARTNLNETAFFYPHLQTDENGDVLINFTIPEALTRWKMLGFAHTKELAYGFTKNELVTQKDLMVTPNAPRFFRENDTMVFTAKITSLTDKDLSGFAQLMLFDALTMKPVDVQMQNNKSQQTFSVKKGESTNLNWNIIIPSGLQAITYRVVAKSGNFSDGEESTLPVLTNSMLVTETLPLPVKGRQTKTYTLDKLIHNTSTTLRNHKLTLEFTSNPAWYAIQALPYLMEYPYECAEQTFSRFYANSIASHIVNSSPRIKQVFDSWVNISPDALLSNLEKNQELKGLMLEETPWVLNAKSESERKRNVALLFDLNRMSNELGRALDKLRKLQMSNGGWPWFEGMPDSRYITQHIVCGMGKLNHLGVKNIRTDEKVWSMVKRAIDYTDARIAEDYRELKRLEKAGLIKLSDNHLDYTQIHYLYARSFFTDISMDSNEKEALDYYLGQARKYWIKNDFYMQGMISLALSRYKDDKIPVDIIKSFKENSITSEEMGMYWKYNSGWFWYQAPIETQALMIEAFDEVAHDSIAVNELKVWLLKQKQTQDWRTTKATVEACYALLLRGTDWLANDEQVDITVGNQKIDPRKMPEVKVEAGTGYFKTSWNGSDIKPEMGKVTVSKKDNGVAWGALYWQYFEQLDKITSAETPLKLKKQLFVERTTNGGPVIQPIVDTTHLKPGDLLKVRIELRVDREMEYVHMKDMRAAGLEPINVLSQYKYQNGLGYYESTRDAATNFFFGWLPKGTYVFEYPLRVTHCGNFSNGITTIQCMYAPEFTSHSEGVRVKVK